jgi:ABC-2 type transport system ATP-binding protein
MRDPQYALRVAGVSKTYATVKAVDDLSFDVAHGEILGLLGHNGAGKTTTIRMILDIIRPDTGQISVLGGPMAEATKERIGYLPEERGLYQDMTVMDTLLFLGQLKGLSRATARERAETYLKLVDLWDARQEKIQALSRGMGQKAQFVAATLHEPRLIIIDEPFSGLDPVNTLRIKELLYRMRDQGAAIIMSTHQMNQVEEMCGRILLLDHGHRLLYGELADIRRQFASNAVQVTLRGEMPAVPGVARVVVQNGGYHLLLEDGVAPESVLKALVEAPGAAVESFAQIQPSLDEIFVRLAGRGAESEGMAR